MAVAVHIKNTTSGNLDWLDVSEFSGITDATEIKAGRTVILFPDSIIGDSASNDDGGLYVEVDGNKEIHAFRMGHLGTIGMLTGTSANHELLIGAGDLSNGITVSVVVDGYWIGEMSN